jgi:hypothetical protein
MYYREAKKLNRRQAQWSLYLLEFNVKLIHTPGNKMVQSDALSRRPDLCPDEDTDNEDIVMLPDDMFVNLIDVDLQEHIAIANNLDGNAAKALKILLDKAPTAMTAGLDDWTLDTINDRHILFYKGRNYIPWDITLWQDIVEMFHDHDTAGHPG